MKVHDVLALGDSFTEGMSDELRPDGHHRGWADRVAEQLALVVPDLRYANLAVRGKLLDEVVVEQLLPSRDLVEDPDTTLVTFHAGPNDLLRPGADTRSVALRYERAVQLLAGTGVRVLLFTVIPRAGGKGRTADLLAERFESFNASVRRSASRHGAVLVDQGRVPALQDRRVWDADRLHLNGEGHRRVTALALSSLSEAGVEVPSSSVEDDSGWWRRPLPEARPTTRAQDVATDLAWVRRHLLPWVGRRLRGTSSGAGREPKDVSLRRVAAAAAAPQSEGAGQAADDAE